LFYQGRFSVFKSDEEGNESKVLEIGKKDFFGEQSVIKHKHHAFAVRAQTDGVVLTFNNVGFSMLSKNDKSIYRSYLKAIDDLWFIKSNSLFRNFADENLSKIVNAFHHKNFASSEYVFKQGDKGDEFYIIRNGEVGVFIQKKSKPIAKLSIGEFFGEIALLRNVARTASIKTLTETETLALSREALQSLLKSDMRMHDQVEFLAEQRMAKLN
jgi:CRP-like cAMP-binding protein